MDPIRLLGTLRTPSYHYSGLARYTQDADNGAGGTGHKNTKDDTERTKTMVMRFPQTTLSRVESLTLRKQVNNMLEVNVNHKFELLQRLDSIESTIENGLNRSAAAQGVLDGSQKRTDQKINRWMYLLVGGLVHTQGRL